MENPKNIKFNYLYRDGGNYKIYGSQVFSNPKKLPLKEIETKITANLIDGEFFDPKEWNIPALVFAEWDEDIDHGWNEFESVEESAEKVTTGTIDEFLQNVKRK